MRATFVCLLMLGLATIACTQNGPGQSHNGQVITQPTEAQVMAKAQATRSRAETVRARRRADERAQLLGLVRDEPTGWQVIRYGQQATKDDLYPVISVLLESPRHHRLSLMTLPVKGGGPLVLVKVGDCLQIKLGVNQPGLLASFMRGDGQVVTQETGLDLRVAGVSLLPATPPARIEAP